MLARHTSVLRFSLSLQILLALGCHADDQIVSKSPQKPLTVEETLGSAFCRPSDTSRIHHYKQANPEAKQALRKILGDDSLSQFHENVWWMLGYIGDESDVERLEKSLEQDFSGVLDTTETERERVQAMLDALGLMVSRKVKGADKLVDRLITPEYWKKARFRWSEKRQPQQPGHVYEAIMRVMIGYSLSMHPDLEKKCAAVIEGIKDPQDKEIMKKAISAKLLQSHAKNTRALEDKPITQKQRKRLESYFNGDLRNPSPADSAQRR